jgi:hypothetical protein
MHWTSGYIPLGTNERILGLFPLKIALNVTWVAARVVSKNLTGLRQNKNQK